MRLSWLKIYIGNLAVLNEQFRDENGAIDFAALGREEYEFRRAVIIGDFSRSERAREIYEICEEEFKARSDAGKKNANKRWNKTPSNNDTEQNATTSGTKTTEPAKNSYGEFSNVKMTTAEFEKLVQAEGAERANSLIEELSSYLASSGKRYKSHYATLLNWGRRKEKEDAPKQKFLTTEEISRRNYEESKKQLAQILEARKHG